ncbi:MAG: hypothetical protein KJN93_08135 [Alphaproteobacteria bacterium]|nr:hypothetical protein [Alphaproteobacteria bacterium]NNF24457.1 hypothetical protein [Paracoccaceae bacterium]
MPILRPAQIRSFSRAALSALVIASTTVLALIGLVFGWLTGGLVSHKSASGALVYCRDTYGSGNDADIVMPVLAVFLIPALIRTARRRSDVAIAELFLVPLPIYLAIMALAVAGCGVGAPHDAFTALPWFAIIDACLLVYPIAMFGLIFVRWPKLILP